MSVRDLLPWRQVLPPAPPDWEMIAAEISGAPAGVMLRPVYDYQPLGDTEGRAPWRGPYGPDPAVFGEPYTPLREDTPGHWRSRTCWDCGAKWHADAAVPCWACGHTTSDN